MTISRLKKIRFMKKKNNNKIIFQKNEDCVTRNNFSYSQHNKFIWRIIKKKISQEKFYEIIAQITLYETQSNQTGITNLLREINKKYGDYNSHVDSHCSNSHKLLNCNNTTNVDHKKWKTSKRNDLIRKKERKEKYCDIL